MCPAWDFTDDDRDVCSLRYYPGAQHTIVSTDNAGRAKAKTVVTHRADMTAGGVQARDGNANTTDGSSGYSAEES